MDPDRLLNHYFHGMLTDEEFHQLQTWLRSDPAHVAYFVRESFIQRSLSDHLRGKCIQENICQAPPLDYDVFADHMSDTSVWEALLEAERTAPGIEREPESPEPEQADEDKQSGKGKRVNKLWGTVTLFSSAAALLVLLLGIVEYVRSQRVVAELGNSVHARWAQMPDANGLRPGPLELREGVAEITLKQGARILVQAPCEFELLSANRLELLGGSLMAFVPEQARGFRVITPQSEIVDFGTEFGVAVASSTAYEVHVFKGRVGLERGGTGKDKDLRGGQCALADASGSIRTEALAQRPRRFLQEMPDIHQVGVPGKRLNLADVVGGGNGFGTGRIGGSPLENLNQGTKIGWPINCVKLRAGQTITIDGVVTPGEYDGAQPVVINKHTATGIDPYQPQYRHQMYGAPQVPNQWRETSLDDFNAIYYVMWDDDALYVAVSVQDDNYQGRDSFASSLQSKYAGDALQFTLSANPSDSHASSVYIPTVIPRGKTTDRAIAISYGKSEIYIKNDLFADPCHPALCAGSVNDETQDWMVEVKIPWHSMTGSFTGDLVNGDADGNKRNVFPPQLLDQIGFSIVVGDSDVVGGQTQLQLFATTHVGAWPWTPTGDKTQETLTFIERPDSFDPLENLPYVDGIFTPHGGPSPWRVSSWGHSFVARLDSSASLPGAIINGWPYEENPFADARSGPNAGSLASTACLSMWGNQGITFDLDRIRADLVGVGIERFTARAVSANSNRTGRTDTDLWILVDGAVRFAHKGLRPAETVDIEVALDERVRFLTLVTTARCAVPMDSSGNWYVFQNPVLELSRP